MTKDRAKIAGLVLAAGYSKRMGAFKPLLPFGDSTVIEKAIGSLMRAGVRDVRVVVGWRADELTPILDRLGVRAVFNPHYESGMYSSVVTGVRSMGPEVEAFLLLPGDHPAVKPRTIQILIDRYLDSQAGIVYPRFLQRRGHPPLIEKRIVQNAPDGDQPGGLRAMLSRYGDVALDVEVADQGVVMDVDDLDDYANVLAYLRREDHLLGDQ